MHTVGVLSISAFRILDHREKGFQVIVGYPLVCSLCFLTKKHQKCGNGNAHGYIRQIGYIGKPFAYQVCHIVDLSGSYCWAVAAAIGYGVVIVPCNAAYR